MVRAWRLLVSPVRAIFRNHELITIHLSDDLYERGTGLASGKTASATKEAVDMGLTYIQSELSTFESGCKVLMKGLDVAAQVHPFVSGNPLLLMGFWKD